MARANSFSLLQPAMAIGWALKHGAVAGIVAGLVFALFEILVAVATQSAPAFFVPLRLVGTMLLGPDAFTPSFSLVSPGAAGLTVHLALSLVYGAMFGALVALSPSRTLDSQTGLAIAGTLFGLALWLANFYVIAPAIFPDYANPAPLVQFVAHTAFFGTALGVAFAQLQRR